MNGSLGAFALMHRASFLRESLSDIDTVFEQFSGRSNCFMTKHVFKLSLRVIGFLFIARGKHVRSRRHSFNIGRVTIRTGNKPLGDLLIETFDGVKPTFKGMAVLANTVENFQSKAFLKKNPSDNFNGFEASTPTLPMLKEVSLQIDHIYKSMPFFYDRMIVMIEKKVFHHMRILKSASLVEIQR